MSKENNFEDEVYVIDSNDKILLKVEEYKQEQIRKRERANEKKVEQFFAELEYDEEGKPKVPVDDEGYYIVPYDEEGNPLVIIGEDGNIVSGETNAEPEDSENGEYPDEEIPPELSEAANQFLEEARAEADRIIEEANAQADGIRLNAKEEGKREGYSDGLVQAQDEYKRKEQEVEETKQNLISQYQDMQESLEKDLVDVICDVVGRAFKSDFYDKRDIILHLVDKTLVGIENSKTFIVRVSEKNHAFLNEKKESLLSRLGGESILDVVIDPLMGDDDCMIETDGGVFNCSIDTELNNLLRDIRLLSTQ